MYTTVKKHVVNLFNGTTFKNIFDAGYKFFVGSSKDDSTKEVDKKIDALVDHVKKLKDIIKSSTQFIHEIIEKIREKGKIKIVNKLNHNPQHPEYESSFPDLNTAPQKQDDFKTMELRALDEHFNSSETEAIYNKTCIPVSKRNKIPEQFDYKKLLKDKEFLKFFNIKQVPEDDMPTSIELDDEMKKTQIVNTINELNIPKHLSEYFMLDFDSSIYAIDGNPIPASTKPKMMENFLKLVSNEQEQKLIAAYANPVLLKKSYLKLIAAHPEINDAQVFRAKNYYEINHLNDGGISIVATNLSNFYSLDSNNVKHNHYFGVRTHTVLSPEKGSTIKYSYFTR